MTEEPWHPLAFGITTTRGGWANSDGAQLPAFALYIMLTTASAYHMTGNNNNNGGISGLVVKSIVAIDGPRVRFTADAFFFRLYHNLFPETGMNILFVLLSFHFRLIMCYKLHGGSCC